LNGPGDVVRGGDPLVAPLGQNGGIGETRMPRPGSPVLDRIPARDCTFGTFGEDMRELEQELAALVADRLAVGAADQRGVRRPQGPMCDVGAVEVGG
jgi:hypothetical protein